MIKPTISFEDFEKVDMRVGKVTRVEDFPEAHNPSYKLWINVLQSKRQGSASERYNFPRAQGEAGPYFGEEVGLKQSSAQIVKNQSKADLLNHQVVCVVNFALKQIGSFKSEVLTLGVQDGTTDPSNWIILTPFKAGHVGGNIK